MNSCALRPCFIDHLFFASDFRQVPRRNFLKFFPSFIHCCFCFVNLQGLRINLCTKLSCCSKLSPLPAIWSSCQFGRDSSRRSLVDSLASKIHTSFDLISLVLPRVSPRLHVLLVLQSIARAIGVSNFLRAFLMVSLNSSSSGSIMKYHPCENDYRCEC